MKIDVKVDIDGIKSEIERIAHNEEVLLFAGNEARRLMEKYVPKQEGDLRDTARVYAETQTAIVEYVQKYAHYQYIGSEVPGVTWDYTTNLTGAYWDKAMVQNEMPKLTNAIEEYIKSKFHF